MLAGINTKTRFRNTMLFGVGFYIVLMFTVPMSAYAMLLDLPNAPLFLGRTIKPNVMFIIDDSGSMDWEILRRPGTFTAGLPGFRNSGNLDMTPTPGDRDETLESCAGYNATYYDPNQTYTPWAGRDENNVAFQDQIIIATRNNPFDANSVVNLLTLNDGAGGVPGYFTWNDADGDNDFDAGECPDPTQGGFNHNASFTTVSEMSITERQNFANWYSYYRKREFVMKRSVTPLVRDFNMRMGLGTLHNNNNVGRAIRDVDDGTNRDILLNRMARINSSGGTPLRQRLRAAGRYYDNTLELSDGLGFKEDSPILPAEDGGMCQQNFTMLMSDGFWNGGSPGVGNDDGDNSSAYDGRSYGDGFSDTLADVAMSFYERDLSPLDNVVPISDARDDTNPGQHMVTYTVSFGLNGTLNAPPTDFDAPFVWPQPVADQATTADDMLHAAWNGRGQFLSASDPTELINALSNVLNDIDARGGTAASAAANGGSISTESRVFQAQFDSRDWSGKLLSFEVNDDGSLSSVPEWDAGVILNSKVPSTRNIISYDPVSGSTQTFVWSNLEPAQQALLNINPDTGLVDGLGEQRVNFLRGENVASAAIRDRDEVLGDLINSDPEFVGAPRFFFNFADYQDFFLANNDSSERRRMVYIGGNDGMLHAFDAESGDEQFAYVPGEVFPRLNRLTDPGYTHEFFVDGSPVHGDIQFPSGSSNWRTILTSGYRSGGQGIFTLNVSNPDGFGANDVMFEFTDDDDNDMGFTYSTPQIVRTNRNASDANPASGDWAIVFGNGYNNTVNDGNPSTTGHAVLYVVFIDDATGGINPGDFIKISTNVGDTTTPNGLGSAGVADIDGDARIEFVYAGDLRGNLWKFDLSDTNSGSWGLANGASALFEARGPNGDVQPITAPPLAITHPLGIGQGALIITGSGKFLETNDIDPDAQSTQTLYAVWDRDASPSINDGVSGIRRGQMSQTTITTASGQRFISTAAEPDWLNADGTVNRRGWFLDLPENGERIVRPAIARSGVIFFVTLIPSMAPCVPGGTGFLMALDSATGGIPNSSQTGNPTVFDTNGDGVFDEFDNPGNNVVIGLEQDGIPAEPAVIFDPRPFCERNPTDPSCDTDGDGIPDVSAGGMFPPGLNSFRGCGSDGTRIYLYTTTSNGNISDASAALSNISCGRQAWRQLR